MKMFSTFAAPIAGLALGCALILGGCRDPAQDYIDAMGPKQRASFDTDVRYRRCLEPFIDRAKAGATLSDAQVDRFGYNCPSELREAAEARERFYSEERKDKIPRELSAPTRAARVQLQEALLAKVAYCSFRTCYVQ